ncbi:hypothetical protein IAT38_001503 [Cryptococcus sp. DSM 104549]
MMYTQQPYGQQPPYGQQNQYPPPQQQQQWAPPPTQGYQQQGYQNSASPQGGMYGGGPPQQQYQQNQGYQGYQQQQPYGGAPPQQSYGAPQSNYGGGPPQNQYGAPPQQGYGAPQGAMGPRFLGVSIHAPPPAVPGSVQGYNPNVDAEKIRKATKGFGTDESALISTMAPLDAKQMDVLSRAYEQMVGKSLKATLESELNSWLEYTLVLLSLGPLAGDVFLLNRACDGAGTHEDLLNEVLLNRSNEEMHYIKEAYRRTYHQDLQQVIQGELSMKTERLFNMALSGQRDESPYVNQQQVTQDIEALYRAGPGKVGTDEITICGILLSRSPEHLKAIGKGFPARHKVALTKMINSEFSGHMRDGLYFIARAYEVDGDGVARDAELLQEAMSGMGTKDERLIYRLVRNHWNRHRFNLIKGHFHKTYGKSLRRAVEGETSGKYEKALVAIIEGM